MFIFAQKEPGEIEKSVIFSILLPYGLRVKSVLPSLVTCQ